MGCLRMKKFDEMDEIAYDGFGAGKSVIRRRFMGQWISILKQFAM